MGKKILGIALPIVLLAGMFLIGTGLKICEKMTEKIQTEAEIFADLTYGTVKIKESKIPGKINVQFYDAKGEFWFVNVEPSIKITVSQSIEDLVNNNIRIFHPGYDIHLKLENVNIWGDNPLTAAMDGHQLYVELAGENFLHAKTNDLYGIEINNDSDVTFQGDGSIYLSSSHCPIMATSITIEENATLEVNLINGVCRDGIKTNTLTNYGTLRVTGGDVAYKAVEVEEIIENYGDIQILKERGIAVKANSIINHSGNLIVKSNIGYSSPTVEVEESMLIEDGLVSVTSNDSSPAIGGEIDTNFSITGGTLEAKALGDEVALFNMQLTMNNGTVLLYSNGDELASKSIDVDKDNEQQFIVQGSEDGHYWKDYQSLYVEKHDNHISLFNNLPPYLRITTKKDNTSRWALGFVIVLLVGGTIVYRRKKSV